EFAGVASAMGIFGISTYLSMPLCSLLVWLLVVKGSYKSVEKVFLVACFFYITYIISGFIANPDWNLVGKSLLSPKFSFNPASISMLVGLVGTTIAPWMQFYLQSAIVEKNVKLKNYKYSQIDVITGSFVVNIVAFFIIVVCAATLFSQGIKINSASEAALALAPLAGKYCSYLFAFGLLNASLFAASILPLSTAYVVCEGMGWENGVNKKFSEAPQFYLLYSLLVFVGAGVILIPRLPLFYIMFLTQVLNGMLLPFVLIFILFLINDKRIMGKYTNKVWFNVIAWITAAVMLALSVILLYSIIF
ncbi:MAG: Mn transporter, partial [candidate division Zixibacteria bacterium SM23_73_2]